MEDSRLLRSNVDDPRFDDDDDDVDRPAGARTDFPDLTAEWFSFGLDGLLQGLGEALQHLPLGPHQ